MKKILGAVIASMFGLVYGVDGTWIGGNIGAWSNAANWENGNIPVQAGDTATFPNGDVMTAVTLDRDVALDKITVAETRLNLYSPAGKTLTFTGTAPEVAVGREAAFRASGTKLVSSVSVKKSGGGRFITVGRAAEKLKFVQNEGSVELEGEARETVTTENSNWASQANNITSGAEAVSESPLGADPGSLVVGNTVSGRTGVTGCRTPIKVDTSFSFSADVEMTGSSAYGFAIAFHNDPRGPLAHSIHTGEYTDSLGYGYTSSNTQSVKDSCVVQGFAFGIYNLYYGNGKVRWGTNGVWEGAETSSPLIYTATGAADASANYCTRWYAVRVDYNAAFRRATLTLVQDQREIVAGGEEKVTYSKTINNVDLVQLCGSDEAFLSLTYSEGGRNILATLRNVKLEYFLQQDRSTVSVVPAENIWANVKCKADTTKDEDTGISPYGTQPGSIRIGYGIGLYGTACGRSERVPVTGDFRISGKVTDVGSGAHGFSVVLHNDPRGPLAHTQPTTGGSTLGYASGNETKIVKSVAFGFRTHGNNGKVSFGRNGTWESTVLTDPKILTSTYDTATQELVPSRAYDFQADFDATVKTLTLKVSQVQDGTTVVSTHVFRDVDVPVVCGDDKAYLSLTSEAGGRTVDVTIDNFVLEYAQTEEKSAKFPFFDTFEQKDRDGVVFVSEAGKDAAVILASTTSFAAGTRLSVLDWAGTVSLGAVSAAGDMDLATRRKTITVDAEDGLWENRKCASGKLEDVATGISPYGAQKGGIRIGYGITMQGTVAGRSERIPVSGDFRISGKVTDDGSGAHGFSIVLHNDPRGCLAHAMPDTGGSSLGYARGGSDTGSIQKSVAFGIYNYAGNNGKVRYGRSGTWEKTELTAPKIVTAPRGDSHSTGTPVRRTYDFIATFDATLKTLTLVLSQIQDGETVTSTHVFAGADVAGFCGDEMAYLTLTSEAGGASVDVTIDDFRIDYGRGARVTYSAQGVLTGAARSVFTLDDALFAVEQDRQIRFDSYRLWADAGFVFAGAYRLAPIAVEREGVLLGNGTYTAESAPWVAGRGTVQITGRGTLILFR